MYYGEDQWECAVEKGSSIKIVEIDSIKIKNPIYTIAKMELKKPNYLF